MVDKEKFLNFLKSLETEPNKELLESIKRGYSTVYETPHAETVNGEPVDFHVEDVVSKFGRREALKYVKILIHNFINNTPTDILFTNPGEIDHLDHPKLDIPENKLRDVLMRLQKIANNI